MHGEKTVGGLRCGEVLDVLSDYVDGSLDPTVRAKVETHVGGCSHCARFGGSFAVMVEAVRQQLRPAPSDTNAARVMAGLRLDLDKG